MNARRVFFVLVAATFVVALFPSVAHACDTCFDQKEKNRLAFFTTTIFLSGLPLGMIAGTTMWIRRKNSESGQ